MPSPDTSSPGQHPLAGLLPALSRPFLWLPHLPALAPGRVTFLNISVVTPGLEISLHLRADRLHDAVGGLSRRCALACRWLPVPPSPLPGPSLGPSCGPLWVVAPSRKGSCHWPGCPVALPALPCGKAVVWRPVVSVHICVHKRLGGGQPGAAGLVLAASHGSAPCWGFPAPYHTDDAPQHNLLPGDNMVCGASHLLTSQAALQQVLPPLLYAGEDSGSETASLAKDRVRTNPHLNPRAHCCLLWPSPTLPRRVRMSW